MKSIHSAWCLTAKVQSSRLRKFYKRANDYRARNPPTKRCIRSRLILKIFAPIRRCCRYELMNQCWLAEPAERPTFADLSQILAELFADLGVEQYDYRRVVEEQ